MPKSTGSDISYGSVHTEDSLDSLDPTDETFEQTLKQLRSKDKPKTEQKPVDAFPKLGTKPELKRKTEVADDFIRNFLRKHGMNRTLDSFQEEWYEIIHKNKNNNMNIAIPDSLVENQSLEDEVQFLRKELARTKEIAHQALEKWDKMKKDRDFNKMHHQRVQVEKKQLLKDLKILRKHCEKYDPTLLELQKKYEAAMKEKMLIRLDRDKQVAQVNALKLQLEESETSKSEKKDTKELKGKTKEKTAMKTLNTTTSLPPDDRVNPFMHRRFASAKIDEFSLADSFQGHTMAISYMAIHPKKPIVATVSDDTTWKMWALPTGKILMSGDGHSDWLSGCDFHPQGTHLATSSGDSTIKIWDFYNSCCSATFTGHSQAVWACEFHDCGDFLVSCSLDHTTKLWDVQTSKCISTFRGQHKDSVNHVTWQPFSNVICTSSGDHSVSLWDGRTSKCVETFYGHEAAVNHCKFSLKGDTLVSCDADGKVFVWDIRMITEIGSLDAGPHASNHVSLDASGDVLVVSSNDGKIRSFNGIKSGKFEPLVELQGHEDAVQVALFDREGKFLVSGGSDCMLRLWS